MARRKNFFVTLILIIFFWSTLFLTVFFTEPKMIKDILIKNSYLFFFINLFLALFLTLAVVFGNSTTGLLTTLGIIGFLILRMYKLGNFLNLVLIASIVFVLNKYFTKPAASRKSQKKD